MGDGGFGAVLLAALAGELALEKLIGLEALQALTRRIEVAWQLAIAMLLVAPLATLTGYLARHGVLMPANATYLEVPVSALLAFGSSYGVALAVRTLRPGAAEWSRLYPPLLAIHGTVLGVVLVTLADATSLPGALLRSVGLAFGYGLSLVVVAQLRERLDSAELPAPFRDLPALLIALSILAMGLSAW
jgi:electron transport complex protein RnfA